VVPIADGRGRIGTKVREANAMGKKIIIFIGIVSIVAGATTAFFYVANKNNNAVKSTNSIAIEQASTPSLPSVSVTTNFPNAPQGSTFVIGTPQGSVTVNNFYNLPPTIDEEFLILENTNDYQITYDTINNQFFIYASSTPLNVARQKGEAAFLTMLGISEQDACKLNVAEGYPQNSSLANDQPALSFCNASSAFQAR
jgi:hypothetical protein